MLHEEGKALVGWNKEWCQKVQHWSGLFYSILFTFTPVVKTPHVRVETARDNFLSRISVLSTDTNFVVGLPAVRLWQVYIRVCSVSKWVWMQPRGSGHVLERASSVRLCARVYIRYLLIFYSVSLLFERNESPQTHIHEVRWKAAQEERAVSLQDPLLEPSAPASWAHHKVSELLLHGLISARLVALCFFNSLVIFSSSEFGSRGLLYSSSSSLSELSFIFSVSESCFFLAEAISAACLFRHLVLLFWNQTCSGGRERDRGGLRRAQSSTGPDRTPDNNNTKKKMLLRVSPYLHLTLGHSQGVGQAGSLWTGQIFRLLKRFFQSKNLLSWKSGSGVFLLSVFVHHDVCLSWKTRRNTWGRELVSQSGFEAPVCRVKWASRAAAASCLSSCVFI